MWGHAMTLKRRDLLYLTGVGLAQAAMPSTISARTRLYETFFLATSNGVKTFVAAEAFKIGRKKSEVTP
jgi:hypothetical protein